MVSPGDIIVLGDSFVGEPLGLASVLASGPSSGSCLVLRLQLVGLRFSYWYSGLVLLVGAVNYLAPGTSFLSDTYNNAELTDSSSGVYLHTELTTKLSQSINSKAADGDNLGPYIPP